jgi:hypothetical protein
VNQEEEEEMVVVEEQDEEKERGRVRRYERALDVYVCVKE